MKSDPVLSYSSDPIVVSPAGKLARQLLALYIGNDRMEGRLGRLIELQYKGTRSPVNPFEQGMCGAGAAQAGWDHFDLVHRIR